MARLEPNDQIITIDFEGQPLQAREGESIATALLAAGENVFSRSVKYHRPRGPFCMSGACSHCLMRVDGVPNTYTCRTKVKPGMKVERQNAYPTAEHDVFGALDWLFPRGMNHHSMFAGVPVAEQVMQKVARHLAGLGELPTKGAPPRLPQQTIHTKVVIAGAGAAGLAAARELAQAGVDFVLLEREGSIGGRLHHGAIGPKDPPLADFAATIGGRAKTSTPIIGLFTDEAGQYLAAVEYTVEGPRLLKVYASRTLIAIGGYPSILPFENNDIPGVYAARAVSRLVRSDKFLPGTSFALVGTGPELYDTARLVADAGGEVSLVLDIHADPPAGAPKQAKHGEAVKAHGRAEVKGFSWKDTGGKEHKVSCDAVVIAIPPTASYELARQGGAEVAWSEADHTFVVKADANGRTAGHEVYVAGEQLRPCTAAEAAESGVRAARAILGGLS